jgi:hypothetical protein
VTVCVSPPPHFWSMRLMISPFCLCDCVCVCLYPHLLDLWGLWYHIDVCVSPNILVFYAVLVISEESRRLFLPKSYCLNYTDLGLLIAQGLAKSSRNPIVLISVDDSVRCRLPAVGQNTSLGKMTNVSHWTKDRWDLCVVTYLITTAYFYSFYCCVYKNHYNL